MLYLYLMYLNVFKCIYVNKFTILLLNNVIKTNNFEYVILIVLI